MTERPAPPTKKASDEARLGASLAFGNSNKPTLKPKPGTGTKARGDNGALAAALSSTAGAGRDRVLDAQNTGNSGRGRGRGGGKGTVRGSFDGTLGRQDTGGSVASEAGNGAARNLRPRLSQYSPAGAGAGYLQPSAADQSRSPSFIAATLAASRSASMSPNPTGGRASQPLSPTPVLGPIPPDLRIQPRYTSRSPSVRSAQSSRASEEMVLDTRSIPPTGNLIGMFEQNAAGVGKESLNSKVVRRPRTPTQSEGIPERTYSSLTGATTPSPLVNKSKKSPPQPLSAKPVIQAKGKLIPRSVTPKPTKPKPQMSPILQERKSSIPSSKPIPVPFQPRKLPPPQDDSSSGESFVSASDIRQASYEEHKPSWRAEIASQNRRRLTSASLHTLNSSVTVNSLADAIVASSLASSRAVSPSKSLYNSSSASGLYPPLPPPRRTKHHHHNPAHLFHNGKNDISRTPSPGKVGNGGTGVLRTTMRKVKSKEEIDEGEKRRGRKNLMKKHPNKHHEGDRKRWRDSVTERERKRYEAVWASNRGLYTGDGLGSENEVCSLVVKDVFSRSRLGEDVLEEVYDLVDRRGIGTLGKEEFVVGLWLVDQRLKGRKLPIRVTESVWKSVGILSGIKVRSMK